jgi:hypothetical protein
VRYRRSKKEDYLKENDKYKKSLNTGQKPVTYDIEDLIVDGF